MAKKKSKESKSKNIAPEIEERNKAYVEYKKAKAERIYAEKTADENTLQECIKKEESLLNSFLQCESVLSEENRIWKHGFKII